MYDIHETIMKNKDAKEQWIKNHKEAYTEKFAPYFDDKEKLDKFMSSMQSIVSLSEDSILLPEVYGFNTKNYHPQYSHILNDDQSINIEKFNKFLDNLERTLYWSSLRASDKGKPQYSRSLDRSEADIVAICEDHFNKAFPNTDKKYHGIDFVLQHFFKNEKCENMVELITPYIKTKYQNSPEAGEKFLERVKKYRENAMEKAQESSALSNDLDKLFAGSSSSLGKGLEGKSKS